MRWELCLCAWVTLGFGALAQEPVGEPPEESVPESVQEPDPEPEERVLIEMRVSVSGTGPIVTVDRGASDGLAEGDEVLFRPRGGGLWRGIVRRADDRSSAVELRDPSFVPVAGTRGEVLVPASRLAGAKRATGVTGGSEGAEAPRPAGPIDPSLPPHPGWRDDDSEWSSDRPLLARVRAVRPEDRSQLYGGRLTFLGDTTTSPDLDRSDALARFGADLWAENPFGFGGRMDFDLAVDEYTFDTFNDDDDVSEIRIDRLAYRWGGTRFARDRVTAGRFVQEAAPELGVLDGVEWEHRLDVEHSFGASLGYMPTPDIDFESFDDLQLAAFHRWSVDGRSDFTVFNALQRTWNNGRPDRDLILSRVDYLPSEGWDLRGTAWIDLYDSDDTKSGLDLTQMWLSTQRRYDRDAIEVTYRHLEHPDILRQEYVESVFEDLTQTAYDRLALTWTHDTLGTTSFRTTAALWRDEEERGGDFETTVNLRNVWLDEDDARASLFAVRGSYSIDAGMRLGWGRSDDDGRWDVRYQFANRRQDEFSSASDDLLEQVVGGSRTFYLNGGWHASLAGEARRFDGDLDLSLTLYVQKTF